MDKGSLEIAVKNSNNIYNVCSLVGLRPTNNNYEFIKKRIERYNIDCSHFNSSIKSNPNKIIYEDSDIFKIHDHFLSTGVIKKRLLKGYKENRCEICGITEWNGKPITLQVHHINGNRNDDRLENLQLLCPNCHSQTDNFCSHTKKYAKHIIKICECCGVEFEASYKEQKLCSVRCREEFAKLNKKIAVDKNTFIQDLKSVDCVMNRLAAKYVVSFATIQKYCKKFNLPWKAAELKQFILNEQPAE